MTNLYQTLTDIKLFRLGAVSSCLWWFIHHDSHLVLRSMCCHETNTDTLVHACMHACFIAQSYLTLCDNMDCSPPGSSVHGVLQARMLEWVAIPSYRGSSLPRDQTQVSHTAGRFFTVWATRGIEINWCMMSILCTYKEFWRAQQFKYILTSVVVVVW